MDLILNDSWGDGWNGNKLTIGYGQTSNDYTLENGSTTTFNLQIPTGSEVTVKYISGGTYSYPSENSYIVQYSGGDVILNVSNLTISGRTDVINVNCEALPPSTPVLTGETTGESTIALSWNDVGADTYTIYDGEDIVAYNITSTNYIVENLNPNTQYCFTVTATNIVDESEYSNELCATTFKEGSTLVTIGEGANTTPYAPIYNYYSSNSISQTIYTSAELGNAGIIKTISFCPSYADNTRNISIYLKNVNRNHFYDIESSSKKWEDLDGAVCVFSGSLRFAADVWTTISLQSDFLYEGSNLLVCVIDNTNSSAGSNGNYFYCDVCGTTEATDIRAIYKGNTSQIDYLNLPQGPSALYSSNSYLIPQVRFLKEPAAASLEVSETSIDLGNVRMGNNFFTEKPFASKDVTVKVTSTKVTSVTCDNTFFTISNVPTGDALGKTFTFNVGYNKEADVTEPQTGNITIAWQDGENITIPVTATPYTATAPDAIEAFETVEFDENNAYTNTPDFANLHDDYKLPGEEVEEGSIGNTPDAVYKFELTEDATISASITGDGINNSYLAIYSEDFGEKDGPSSDNNNPGVQSGQGGGSSAPTTFGPYTFTTDGTDLTNNFNSSGWVHHAYGHDYIYTSTAGSYILTKIPFQITNNSVLSFAAKNVYASGTEYYNVFISTDDVYGNADDIIVKTGSTTSTTNESIPLGNYSGNEYYIGISYTTKYNMVGVDELALTGGDNQSQAISTIDGVQYAAGTYYLVAAADKAFTVNLSTASVPAPADFALTAPENDATGQDNPKLTWETAQYALSYNVYIGTSEDLTNVQPIEVTTNSYQTEGLQNNTKYYWTVEAVNAKGTTATTSGTWSFVTTLDVPQITVTSENHIAGGDISLSWNEIEGAKYNVYVGDNCDNATPITATEYTISKVDYSKEGLNITVTAVYEGLGESEKSAAVNVKVTGYGTISLNVNGGISNVNYTINGTDESGNAVEEITGTTDEYGMATVRVLVGTYTVTVSKFDYKDATMENVVVEYNKTIEKSIEMTQNPAASFAVTAVDNATTANVSWTTDEYTTFNVYRRNVKTDEVEKIASNVYYKQYQDAAWNEFAVGDEYEYGVSTYVEEDAVLMNEGFEHEGTFPAGWNTQQPNYTYYWQLISNYIYINGSYHYPYEGSYGMVMKGNGGYEYTSGNYLYLITPEIDLSNYVFPSLSFYYRNYTAQSYVNRLYIKVKTETSGWEDVITISNATTNYEKMTVTDALQKYSGQKIQIAFVVQRYGGQATFLDNVVVTAKQQLESRVNWASPITKEAWVTFNGTEDNTWSEKNVLVAADHTIKGEVTVNKLSINGGTLTVAKDAKLTVNGKLTNATSAKFVIEDGAQVFQSSADVKATFNMGIINPSEWSSENKDGWNFVSSPFTNAGLSQFTADYSGKGLDLYRYNGVEEGAEWRNYNGNNAEFASNNFDLGYGYMLAHETKKSVALFGTLNNASEHEWEVSYTENAGNGDLANFHLVGNPFSFNMDMSKLAQTNMVEGYAVLNTAGNGYEYLTSGIINVGDAFFVKTTGEDPTISYGASKGERDRGEKAQSINLIATGAEGSDNVIINLAGAEKEGFNKLQNFNEAIANIFVAVNDTRYGIANFDKDVTMVNVAFEAKEMGNYTIAAQPQGKFKTLVLVDRFTGIETNLLVEDYNFTATSNDDFNRFIVKLEVNSQEPTANSNFAYVSGEDLILNIEGSVQIIDVMGRVVYANDVTSDNNRINVSDFENAAYVIRVVNENGVKTQKIVL
ncbi:MAG: T9SS type A sorting domain-containing protein [Bacteroidales bacterium]|nr:T9SS type A sorting domain-containing protein [Bacteroidales bacterium]